MYIPLDILDLNSDFVAPLLTDLWPWESYLTFPFFSFLIWKMEWGWKPSHNVVKTKEMRQFHMRQSEECLAHSQCYVSTVIVLCHSLSLSLSLTHTHTQPVIVLSRDDVPYSLFPVLQYFFTVFESKRSILHLSRVY